MGTILGADASNNKNSNNIKLYHKFDLNNKKVTHICFLQRNNCLFFVRFRCCFRFFCFVFYRINCASLAIMLACEFSPSLHILFRRQPMVSVTYIHLEGHLHKYNVYHKLYQKLILKCNFFCADRKKIEILKFQKSSHRKRSG